MFQKVSKELKNGLVSLFIAIIIVIPFRYFIIEPYVVQGISMSPNFASYDYILVDKLSTKLKGPERGDIIVFVPPMKRLDSGKNFFPIIDQRVKFIKRVVALPGEKIKIEDKKVGIKKKDGKEFKELKEPYLKNHTLLKNQTIELAKDEYFVLGDNRGYSFDSEEGGPIKRSDILGEPILRLFPFKDFSGKPAKYNFDF